MFQRILVVCTGNICRSPLAEVLLQERLRPQGIEVRSAGTGALIGYPADPLSLAVARDAGFDLSAHRAQQATRELLSAQDLVLTLDRGHSDWINARHPQLRGRVHKLLKWRDDADVADPYQLPREAFDTAWAAIEQGVADWLPRLR